MCNGLKLNNSDVCIQLKLGGDDDVQSPVQTGLCVPTGKFALILLTIKKEIKV